MSDHTMRALVENVDVPYVRARLMVLSSFCRAHSQRLLTRMGLLRPKRLLYVVPPEDYEVGDEILVGLRMEASRASEHCLRYKNAAELARQYADLSSAWVCELNHDEERDRARELLSLVDKLSEVKVA